MRVGFFGGTFDPVHNGHVNMVEDAIRLGHLDRLLVVPAGRTVHKPVERVSSAGMRYLMCHLAFASVRGVEVSRIEVLRELGS
jgi:nicotinate-nucleotide adenylyltransferase